MTLDPYHDANTYQHAIDKAAREQEAKEHAERLARAEADNQRRIADREARAQAARDAQQAEDRARAEAELKDHLRQGFMLTPSATPEDFERNYPQLRDEYLRKEAVEAPIREMEAHRQRLGLGSRF